jgi:hypothetical protein
MSNQDFANSTKFLAPGMISVDVIRRAQKSDSFAKNLLQSKSKRFVKIDDVLFHVSPKPKQKSISFAKHFARRSNSV